MVGQRNLRSAVGMMGIVGDCGFGGKSGVWFFCGRVWRAGCLGLVFCWVVVWVFAMGYADQGGVRVKGPSRFLGAPATKWLLIANVVVFLLDQAGAGEGSMGRLKEMFGFTIADGIYGGEVWRLLTFQFLHFGGFHLFSNMLAVFFFGAFVERELGTKRFCWYYLLCGAAGALFYTVLALGGVVEGWGLLCGASAGIFGILVALIIIAPDMRVMLLFPPIPMKMRTLGLIFLGIAVVAVLTNFNNNDGGEAGHLGGAMMGFLLMRFPGLLSFVDGKGRVKRRKGKPKVRQEAKIRPRTIVNLQGDEVDAILDKVSAEGFQSLTEKERAVLDKAAKKNL